MTQANKQQDAHPVGPLDSTVASACGCQGSLETLLAPRLFKALGDPTRVSLLCELARCCGPRTVSELSRCCPVDLSVVSRHLSVLREAGVLGATKRGKEVHYAVRYDEIVRSLRQIADAIEACCPSDPAADRDEDLTHPN